MWRQIEKNAAGRARLFAPGTGFRKGAEAIVGGFEADDATERTGRDVLAKGLEVGVKATIVIDGEDELLLFCEIKEGDGFRDGSGKGLVDDDVTARFEAPLRQRKVGLVWSGNGHEADGINGEEFI